MKLESFIRDIPDFPKKGIVFKDITPLLQDPQAFQKTIHTFADLLKQGKNFSSLKYIIGIESRGFIFASALAFHLNLGLILIRKKGKLPFKTHQASYALEYGEDILEIHTDAFKPMDKVVIVDDVLATGGTIEAVEGLIQNMGGSIENILFVMELSSLKGREKLKNQNINVLIQCP